jgi:hypothetical protein
MIAMLSRINALRISAPMNNETHQADLQPLKSCDLRFAAQLFTATCFSSSLWQ